MYGREDDYMEDLWGYNFLTPSSHQITTTSTIMIMITILKKDMTTMLPTMNLHRGHGVGVALCQVLQGAVVPVRATRIIKVSLTIVHDNDHNDHDVDIAVSQTESAR